MKSGRLSLPIALPPALPLLNQGHHARWGFLLICCVACLGLPMSCSADERSYQGILLPVGPRHI